MSAIEWVPSEYADADTDEDKALVVEAIGDREVVRVACDGGDSATQRGWPQ